MAGREKVWLAPQAGLEPATHCLEGCGARKRHKLRNTPDYDPLTLTRQRQSVGHFGPDFALVKSVYQSKELTRLRNPKWPTDCEPGGTFQKPIRHFVHKIGAILTIMLRLGWTHWFRYVDNVDALESVFSEQSGNVCLVIAISGIESMLAV